MSFINKLFELDNSEIIYGLTDELKCIYISQRYKKLDKSILIVLNTLYEANRLYQSLSNYIDDYIFSTALGTSTGADTKINVYLGEGHYTLIMERIY